MTDEWVLVPTIATTRMEAEGYQQNEHMGEAWLNMLAARPPVPRAVWDAMVERGYKALWTGSKYNGVDAALRAALNNPEVADE